MGVAFRQNDLFIAEPRRLLDDLLRVLHRAQISGQPDLAHRQSPFARGDILERRIDRQRGREVRPGSLRSDSSDDIDVDILIAQRHADDFFEYGENHIQTRVVHTDRGSARETDIRRTDQRLHLKHHRSAALIDGGCDRALRLVLSVL